jgi:hypothetical protein
MPLPPIDPKRSPRAPPRSTGARRPTSRSAKAGNAAATTQGPPVPPSLSSAVANNINNDEQSTRDEIERFEQLSYCAMTVHRNDNAVLGIQRETERTRQTVAEFAAIARRHDDVAGATAATLDATVTRSNELFEMLSGYIQHTQSSDAARLAELERKCVLLTRDLQASRNEAEKLNGENTSLRTAISKKLIYAEIQHEALRDEVRKSLEEHRLDFNTLRTGLHHRVDSAVLQYHKPQFESALEALKIHQQEVQRAVDEHSMRLHNVIDTIGATGVEVEVKTMHSQIPISVRRELEHFTKDQLLSLLDLLSYESGVVAGVARAVATAEHRHTQVVF